MGIHRTWLALVIALAPSAAYADRHRADAFAARSNVWESNLDGYTLSGSWPLFVHHPCKPTPGHICPSDPKPPSHSPSFSVFGTLGRYDGFSDDKETMPLTLTQFTGGMRYTFKGHLWTDWQPYLQVGFGGVDIVEAPRTPRVQGVLLAGGGFQPRVPFIGNIHKRLRLRVHGEFFARPHHSGFTLTYGFAFQYGPDF